jgi:Vacuolar protein sorting-associated protein 62
MLAAALIAAAVSGATPVLVHDARERHPVAAIDAPERAAAYVRAAPSRRGGAWLQYWFWYAAQDQDRGIVRTGRHAGDWEMVQYRIEDGRIEEAVYAQHSGAERCPGSGVERRGGRPVVYVARGSHASYLRPGTRDRTWPDPNDEANGAGRDVVPRVVVVDEASPSWMRRSAPWGAARGRWWIPGEQDSPRGPAFQPERWDADAWADAAHGCRVGCDSVDECDGRETTLGAAGIALGAGALGFGLLRRRRRLR